jgi:hypothetical protein
MIDIVQRRCGVDNAVVKVFVAAAAAAAALSVTAVPRINDDVTVTVDGSRVVVDYELLDEPAVVTVDFCTNGTDGAWVSIGGKHQRRVAGDVNRLITATGTPLRLTWIPGADWPGNLATVRANVTAWPTNDPPDWMEVSLVVSNTVRYFTTADRLPHGDITNVIYKTEKMLLRKIPAAYVTWRAGEPLQSRAISGYDTRIAPRLTALTSDYYIGVFPVTVMQRRLMTLGGDNSWSTTKPYWYSDAELKPAMETYNTLRGTTDDTFAGWPADGHVLKPEAHLLKYRVHTGVELDLPTDAEWEFACRAGTLTALNNGVNCSSAGLDEVAWYSGNNSSKAMKPVGLKKPNAWGLYDMHGNYIQWCLDWYASPGHEAEVLVDPRGPSSGTDRVMRGGWHNNAYQFLASGMRFNAAPTVSAIFRLRAPAIAK